MGLDVMVYAHATGLTSCLSRQGQPVVLMHLPYWHTIFLLH